MLPAQPLNVKYEVAMSNVDPLNEQTGQLGLLVISHTWCVCARNAIKSHKKALRKSIFPPFNTFTLELCDVKTAPTAVTAVLLTVLHGLRSCFVCIFMLDKGFISSSLNEPNTKQTQNKR